MILTNDQSEKLATWTGRQFREIAQASEDALVGIFHKKMTCGKKFYFISTECKQEGFFKVKITFNGITGQFQAKDYATALTIACLNFIDAEEAAKAKENEEEWVPFTGLHEELVSRLPLAMRYVDGVLQVKEVAQ